MRSRDNSVLAGVHFDGSFAFPAIDALVMEIDALDTTTLAGEVDDAAGRFFREPMAHFRLESFIITHGHDHIVDFDGRILYSYLKLSKPAFRSADIDLVAIIVKIHFTLTEPRRPWRRVIKTKKPALSHES